MRNWKGFLGLALVVAAIAGCEKTLFDDGQARSPYDRYLVLRGQGRPASENNGYGGEQPALRERLKPLGSP